MATLLELSSTTIVVILNNNKICQLIEYGKMTKRSKDTCIPWHRLRILVAESLVALWTKAALPFGRAPFGGCCGEFALRESLALAVWENFPPEYFHQSAVVIFYFEGSSLPWQLGVASARLRSKVVVLVLLGQVDLFPIVVHFSTFAIFGTVDQHRRRECCF
ncbi:hypothetical protein Tsp_05714 [Trichinella spiralis]|uniref:hypothetical protein n=1 Tax=Trichinella spiralis TaxID=6334 RepID=UPI0001EFE902|nr:hypothetical protein Tsp_05714 [Trichinella spiralis]